MDGYHRLNTDGWGEAITQVGQPDKITFKCLSFDQINVFCTTNVSS